MAYAQSDWFRRLSLFIACIFSVVCLSPAQFGIRPESLPKFSFGPELAYADPADSLSQPLGQLAAYGSSVELLELDGTKIRVRYVVSNNNKVTLTDVRLGTTLAPGVVLRSSNPAASVSGPELSFSLGDVSAHNVSEVVLELERGAGNGAVDEGAKIYVGYLGLPLVLSSGPTLVKLPSAPPELLAATPDANASDPFIISLAGKLEHDPVRMFSFVRDNIRFEGYAGSLRGARGTLLGKAGNALDKSNLLIALLRASGIPAQYVQGALSDAKAKELIRSMFPKSLEVIGYVPAGDEVADPENDAQLLSEVKSHIWVEFDADGNGFVSADPSFATGQIGQEAAAPEQTFATVPENLRHLVTLRVKAELTTPSLLGGSFQSLSTVLEQTFPSVSLVSYPIHLQHFINSNSPPTLGFSYTAFTYSPYITIDRTDGLAKETELVKGTDYQEVLTNFPFGSQALTGVFLDVDINQPDGLGSTYTKTIVDKIGYEIRQHGGTPAAAAAVGPALTPFDITTVYVAPGELPDTYEARRGAALNQFQTELAAIKPRIDAMTAANPTSLTPEEQDFADKARELQLAGQRDFLSFIAERFYSLSATFNEATKGGAYAAIYSASPRVVVASQRVEYENGQGKISTNLDLLKDNARVILSPGQSSGARFAAGMQRGIAENVAETTALLIDGLPTPITTYTIFKAAQEQGISQVSLSTGNLSLLESLPLSAQAKARIANAIENNKLILVPSAMVNIGGKSTVGWYEIDGETADTVGVLEDGSHGAGSVQWAAILVTTLESLWFGGYFFLLGFIGGFMTTTLVGCILAIGFIIEKNHKSDLESGMNFVGGFIGLDGLNPASPGGYWEVLMAGILKLAKFMGGIATHIPIASGFGLMFGLALGCEAGLRLVKFLLSHSDPVLQPIRTYLSALGDVSSVSEQVSGSGTLLGGPVQASQQSSYSHFQGEMNVSFGGPLTFGAEAKIFHSPDATVRDSNGNILGSGVVSLQGLTSVPLQVSTTGTLEIQGEGKLSFYGEATNLVGASGSWSDYLANANGPSTFVVTTDRLFVAGTQLPNGTFSVETTSANFSGSGVGLNSNFVAGVQFSLAHGVLEVGPGTGNLDVNGDTFDSSQGYGMNDFTGTVSIAASGDTDTIGLSGTTGGLALLESLLTSFTTDQNSAILAEPQILSTSGGEFTLTARAPPGWTLAFTAEKKLSITPANGVQSGSYPVYLSAESEGENKMTTTLVYTVTVGETSPGLNIGIAHDPLFQIPYSGREVPTAFTAEVRNLGPEAETVALTTTDAPVGFDLVLAQSDLQIPPGGVARIGVYLFPTGVLPQPGTIINFGLEASSVANSLTSIASTSFIMPEIHAVEVVFNPRRASSPPGVLTSAELRLKNIGNVDEPTVDLEALPATGLIVGAPITPLSLAQGEESTQTIDLTPDSSVSLGTTLGTQLKVSYAGITLVSGIAVEVAIPGAGAADQAALDAAFAGDINLSKAFKDLSRSITDLYQNPADPVRQQTVMSDIDNLISILDGEEFDGINAQLASVRDGIGTGDTSLILTLLTFFDGIIQAINEVKAASKAFNFRMYLLPNTAVAQPNVPTAFSVFLESIGTQTTEIEVTLLNLPVGLNGVVENSVVTIPAGGVTQLPNVVLTFTSQSLAPTSFTVNAAVLNQGGESIQHSARGSFTVRNESVQVFSVVAAPPFVASGESVQVFAKSIAALNESRNIKFLYQVENETGTVLRTSTQIVEPFTLASDIHFLSLPSLDTTGLANGQYKIRVIALEAADESPIPGAEALVGLFVGTPIEASLSVSPDQVGPGFSNIDAYLNVKSAGGLGNGLELLGSTSVGAVSGNQFAIKDDKVYIGTGSSGTVADITDPANPVVVGTFGSGLPIQGIALGGANDENIVTGAQQPSSGANNDSVVNVFSLANPSAPNLLTTTPLLLPNRQFFVGIYPHGNRTYMMQGGFRYLLNGGDIYEHWGGITAVDVSNPAAPSFVGAFYNDVIDDPINPPILVNGGGPGFSVSMVDINDSTVYHLTTSGSQDNPGSGQGLVRIFNLADPASPTLTKSMLIPNTAHILDGAVDGTKLMLLGSSGGIKDPGGDFRFLGNVVLTELDISDPANPFVTKQQAFPAYSVNFVTRLKRISAGKWFIGENFARVSDGQSVFGIANSDQPGVIGLETLPAFPGAAAYQFEVYKGNLVIVAPPPAGLLIYSLENISSAAVTAKVDVPKRPDVNILPVTFNIPPSSTIDNGDHYTLFWDADKFPLPYQEFNLTITWKLQLLGMKATEAREVLQGGAVDFLYNGAPGQVSLPPAYVSSGFVLGLDPKSQGVQPGGTAHYFVKVDNSFGSTTTYNLSVVGINPDWVSLPSQVTVTGSTTEFAELFITPDPNAAAAEYHFTVLATPAGLPTSFAGSVDGSVVVSGDPIRADGLADGVTVQLLPNVSVAGQGVPAKYRVRVTNTGQSARIFGLSFSAPGFTGLFDTDFFEILPGRSNFKETTLSLTPEAGNTGGADPFTVTAQSFLDDPVTDTTNGVANVISQGVALELTPNPGQPNSEMILRVTNKGTANDTFTLSIAGPAAPFVELTEGEVSLPPGGSQNITLLVGDLPLSLPSLVSLVASAVSQTNAAAQFQVQGHVQVQGTHDMGLAFAPDEAVLAQPGETLLFLHVDNTGNMADEYSVEIVDFSSDLTATLIGLAGDVVQRVPSFQLPGLTQGGFLVKANKPSIGEGTVTVRLTSASQEGFIEATAVVRVLGSDDLCPDDETKTAPGVCGCNVPDTDSDEDGTADCVDSCPADFSKTAPGVCGCGVTDSDSDQDGTPNCNDSCSLDPMKLLPGICGCGTAETDSDFDGTPNCVDTCPADNGKTLPGICGCGTSDVDTDQDGTANCNDSCSLDPNKVTPGVCGCGLSEEDSDDDGIPNCNDTCPTTEDRDEDGIPDCVDSCPLDREKSLAGICGCGMPETDTDGDSTPDCIDTCPVDSQKVAPGVCGCGILDADADGDGVLNCLDSCASDPAKTVPGVCGCGVADTDTDADRTANCNDSCPLDSQKTQGGICGCGVSDVDSNGDGVPNCQESPQTCAGTCNGSTPNVDEDGDGVTNCQEASDQTNACDAGSFVSRLNPISCAGANAYLQQINIATVLNKLSTPLGFVVEYRDSTGVVRGKVSFLLDSLLKRDIILNDLGLAADTYGTVCVSAQTQQLGAWSGGVTVYKSNSMTPQLGADEAFDFALYYPFENPQRGTASLTLNTNSIGTDGLGLVANWIRITDAKMGDGTGLQGVLRYFRADGSLATEEAVNLPDGGRFDFPAHERIGMNQFGIAEFIPANDISEFYFEESRYFYQGVAANSKTFYTAFTLPRRPLTGAAVTGRTPVRANEVSVLEIINGSSNIAQASLKLFGEGGSALGTEAVNLPSKGSFHRIILPGPNSSSTVQTAEVTGPAESLAVTTLSYVFDNDNGLLYGYAQPFSESAGPLQFTEFNSYLGHKNVLDLANATDKEIPVSVKVLNIDSSPLMDFTSSLPARGNLEFNLAVPKDTYGTVIVDSGSALGVVATGRVERMGDYLLTFPAK